MIYKLSLFILIILLFNSCGTVENSNTKSNENIKITCREKTSINNLNKIELTQSIPIEPTNKLQLLLLDKPTFKETYFDRKGVYSLFQTEYFWADKVQKNLDISKYTNPQTLIDDIKYEKDRWSFAITKKLYTDAMSQKSIGFGFSCYDTNRGCLITYVRIDSPADKIDLRRGDIIQKSNNIEATKELIYKQGQEEKLIKFELLRPNKNQECSGKLFPKEYNYKVVDSKIINSYNSEKIGYFRLDSFLGDDKILSQIDTAFNSFKKESIKKLIIDLRYNGGGSVDLASKLLDKLTINRDNQRQFTLAWNDNYKKNNQFYTFKETSNSLDLKQIIFLTTQSSASASELIISAMKPYLPEKDVVVIGDRTHGKPVGMSGQYDGNYYYFLINFVVKNSLGFYDYFEGIPVTSGCNVADDPFHEMGDTKESMLKSALLYIKKGSCQ